MSTMIIRNIDDHLQEKLQSSAEKHGRSIEEKVIDILQYNFLTEKARQKNSLTLFLIE